MENNKSSEYHVFDANEEFRILDRLDLKVIR